MRTTAAAAAAGVRGFGSGNEVRPVDRTGWWTGASPVSEGTIRVRKNVAERFLVNV
jgi:hypothetical protein